MTPYLSGLLRDYSGGFVLDWQIHALLVVVLIAITALPSAQLPAGVRRIIFLSLPLPIVTLLLLLGDNNEKGQ